MSISSATLTRILNDARVALPGALDSNLLAELFNVLDEFFMKSDAWAVSFTLTTSAGVTSYDVTADIPTGAKIAHFMNLYDTYNIPVQAYLSLPHTIILQTSPSSPSDMTLWLSFTVNDPVDNTTHAPTVPDEVVSRYYAGIVDGLKARMMAQKSKPYSSDTLSLFHWRRFNRAVAVAKAETQHGYRWRSQAWAYPSNFRFRRGRNG